MKINDIVLINKFEDKSLLLYLVSVVLTAFVEIGIILIVDGDSRSRIHGILDDRNQTIGLALLLVGFGLMPILNMGVAFILIVMWGLMNYDLLSVCKSGD